MTSLVFVLDLILNFPYTHSEFRLKPEDDIDAYREVGGR
jgi:hypothetical protein